MGIVINYSYSYIIKLLSISFSHFLLKVREIYWKTHVLLRNWKSNGFYVKIFACGERPEAVWRGGSSRLPQPLAGTLLVQVFSGTRSRMGSSPEQSNFPRLRVPFLRWPEAICDELSRDAISSCRCTMAPHSQWRHNSRIGGVRSTFCCCVGCIVKFSFMHRL